MPQKPQIQNDQEEWRQVLGTCRIVWGGILFMLILFTFYTQKIYLAGAMSETPAGSSPGWIWILQALGLVTFVVALGMTRWFLPRWLRARPSQRGSISPVQKAALLTILSLSLLEAVGIYGLILALIQGRFEAAYPFLLAAFVGLFLRFPQRDFFEEIANLSPLSPPHPDSSTSHPIEEPER